MRMSWLLRLPGPSCPTEALCGDPVFDAYIRDLDARLLGSKKVRLVTLAEIKDHFLAQKAQPVAEGHDPHSAAEETVRSMGDPAVHAAHQRRHLLNRFFCVGFPCWLIYSTMYVLLDWFTGVSTAGRILVALLEGLCLGAWMGVVMGYARTDRRLARNGLTSPWWSVKFDVALPKGFRRLSTAMMAAVFFGAIMVLAAGMGDVVRAEAWGRGVLRGSVLIGIAAMLFAFVPVLGVGRRAFRVYEGGFDLEEWTGTCQRVDWSDIVAAGAYGEARPWIARLCGWRGVKYIDHLTGRGKKRRVVVLGTMLNADRFLCLAEEKLKQRREPAASAG